MSTKDKDIKTLDKLKQFFRINKGGQGGYRQKEDFILTVELEKDLSSESPTNVRIKTIKELFETVISNRLEENAVAKLWTLLEDLVNNICKDNRHLVFSFFRTVIQGQYERLGMMRSHFFKLIKTHSIPEDLLPRFELFHSLTDNGKDILYLEEEVGTFILEWMTIITEIGREQDFLNIIINIIKYNASYLDEEIIVGIVQGTCTLCCQSQDEPVVISCLQVLDTIVCYTNLPSGSLLPFIATLCRTVNIEIYCPTSWKIMRNLLGTHLGHSSLNTMCSILISDTSVGDVGLLRGAVFYINMALWGSKRVHSLKCTPVAVLPCFLSAVRCRHAVVMYEVMLSVQRLVNKRGNELLDPAWFMVLDIIKLVIKYIEEFECAPPLDEVSTHLHETLDTIENLIESGMFNGCVRKVFDIIEKCSALRPESSVQRLISYISATITPAHSRWLDKLDSLLFRFYIQEERPGIRLTVLGILSNIVQNNRRLFEKELVRIVLGHLSNIYEEPNINVRTSATQLLVDLYLNCDSVRALEIMDVLEKILNRAFDRSIIAKGEEDAEDIKITAHGLVQGLKTSMYQHPPTPAVRAFHLITAHLDKHYSFPSHLNQVTSIRYMMLECLLHLRADKHHRIGVVSPNPRYSIFLKTHNSASTSPADCSGALVYHLPICQATKAIIKAIRHESDWKVMLLLIQEVPNMLKNRALLVSKYSSEVGSLASAICAMICEKSLCLPERLKNTPPKFTRSDFHNYVFPVLSSLVPYHAQLESILQQRLIKCLECGLASKSARQCVTSLTICILEMRDAMVKLLPEVLLNLSKISATVHIAISILEFLSTLTQLPKVFANFVGDQYMSVFAISLPYTNHFKYNHYTVSLAHHVIAAWFLKCRLPFRRDFVKFIIEGMKANMLPEKSEIINEDSSNRKRSSSLTEQGSCKSSAYDIKPKKVDGLMAFNKELTETCIDLMAMYSFSTSSPIPKRQSTAEILLSGGQSMTWLLGNKLITVTTSGCTLKALKHGLCDRCFQVCSFQPEYYEYVENEVIRHRKSSSRSSESNTGKSGAPDQDKTTGIEASSKKTESIRFVNETYERQVCACWCQGWAEIYIRRPTGAMSWVMRLQNEPHSSHARDFSNSDMSTFYLPPFGGRPFEEQIVSRVTERVASEPVSIPCSPIRRNTHHDFEDFGLENITEEGGITRSRNPVRRSNSSPEMSSNWKNPLLNSSSDSDSDMDPKKKQNYPKDLRGNCEAIPEEMGTTPPTSEALMLAPMDRIDTKPPVPTPTSPRLPRDVSDPSGLPPLAFKRDRGHTISVMSPIRKPGIRDWESQPRSPKPKDTPQQNRSGVNPAFVFLQLYHSAHFGPPHDRPILVSNTPSVQTTLKNLDWIPPYEAHKIGVLYVAPGQANSEVDILRNEHGSPRYVEFLQRLGTLINLADADRQHLFLGGLDTNGSDGKFAYIWQDDVMQVIFHVATLMPNATNDPQANNKKRHIGNNYVTIVYNDSGEDYNFHTVKAQFNYAVVVVEPLDHGTNQIVVKAKEELVQQICHTEYKVISDQSVAILARQLALHSNLASMISSRKDHRAREPYASNWLERLRLIKRIHHKLQQEQQGSSSGGNDDRVHVRHNVHRMQMDEFTEYT